MDETKTKKRLGSNGILTVKFSCSLCGFLKKSTVKRVAAVCMYDFVFIIYLPSWLGKTFLRDLDRFTELTFVLLLAMAEAVVPSCWWWWVMFGSGARTCMDCFVHLPTNPATREANQPERESN